LQQLTFAEVPLAIYLQYVSTSMYEVVFPQGQYEHVSNGQFPPQVSDFAERISTNTSSILAKVFLPKKSRIISSILLNNKIIRYALF